MTAAQGHITSAPGTSAQAKDTYQNMFRADMRSDSRMAGSRAAFSAMVKDSAASSAASSANAASGAASPDSGGGFIGFIKTVIDIINPLQHIPVISTMYRHITGDEISPVARIAGGALFGGPIGLAAGVVNAAVEDSTGKDVGANVLAMVTGGDKSAPAHAPLPAPSETAPVMLAASDIVWHTPDITNQQRNTQPAATQMAALAAQEFPLSDTPTTLRMRTSGNIAPDGGSLPSVSPAIQTKTGMLVPTQPAERTHTGQLAGAARQPAPDVGERNPALHLAEATPVLQSQNAPVSSARRADAPEQIATHSEPPADKKSANGSLGIVSPVADNRLVPQQMMAALEKYAALKKSQNAAASTGRLVPSFH